MVPGLEAVTDAAHVQTTLAGVRTPKRIFYGDGGDAEMCFVYGHRPDVRRTQLTDYFQQWQNWRLHRVEMRRKGSADGACGGTKVREYRLKSRPDRTKDPRWLRLERLQLCGRGTGANAGLDCLAPLRLAWRETTVPLPHGAQTTVGSLTDPLGRKTEFTYQVLSKSGDDDWVLSALETPFGTEAAPADGRQLKSLSGKAKEVVTEGEHGHTPFRPTVGECLGDPFPELDWVTGASPAAGVGSGVSHDWERGRDALEPTVIRGFPLGPDFVGAERVPRLEGVPPSHGEQRRPSAARWAESSPWPDAPNRLPYPTDLVGN